MDNTKVLPPVYRMSLPSTHSALAAALRKRLAVISDREFYQRDPAAHLEELKAASETIIALQADLPRPLDPQLAHYLQRASYDKALAHLEQVTGPDASSGSPERF